MNVPKLVEYLIIIAAFVILIMIFFSGSGGFAKAKSAASDTFGFFSKILPTVKVGVNETKSSGPALPTEETQQISALQRAVENMANSPNVECVYNVALFSGLEQSTLSIQYDSTAKATRFSVGGKIPGQEITSSRFSVADVQPCVIAGEAVTDLFVKRYFTNKSGKIAYTPVNAISISNEEIIYNGINGGSLSGREWLYKPDATHICFFPLEDGVSQDYFEDGSFEELNTCS